MFMLGTGFFFFCFLIAIGYFLYKYFSHFGVNILSVTFLIVMSILFFIIFHLFCQNFGMPELIHQNNLYWNTRMKNKYQKK